ncbi:heme ABC transporter ATP-binding protein [Chloroflexota bacterium]
MIKLQMDGVSLGYGRRRVVSDLSFQVSPGEMVGLIGPNGCGKTSIIKALCRVIPHSGRIFVDGREISAIPRKDLARLLGVVPQNPSLPDAFTVFEVVLMGRNPHLGLLRYESHKDMDIARRAMEKTETDSLAERRMGELSGGERQRVTVARVLAQEPEAILLDEPTANLDISHQVEILGLIRDLCREKGLTVLVALHDLNLAAQYCDRLLLVANGKLHAEGAAWEVITPENIREVYGMESHVYPHPVNRLPVVLPGGHRK